VKSSLRQEGDHQRKIRNQGQGVGQVMVKNHLKTLWGPLKNHYAQRGGCGGKKSKRVATNLKKPKTRGLSKPQQISISGAERPAREMARKPRSWPSLALD